MTNENDMKYKFQCPQMRFHWNTATFFHLSMAYGCFGAAVAEFSVWDKHHMACTPHNDIY